MRGGGTETLTADALGALVREHADRVHDLALRSGCAPHEAVDVVQTAALQVVARAAQGLADLPSVVGAWYAGALAGGEVPGGGGSGGDGPRGGVADRPGEPLAAVTGPARTALLLRDAYDLPMQTVANALGVAPDEAERTVGQARLALRPELAGGHPVDVGALARLAEDGGRTERHLRGCAACQRRLQAQREVRQLLGGLSVAALPEEQRDGLLERVCVRARAVLAPHAPPVGRDPVLPRLPAALALLCAVAAGGGVGWLSTAPERVPVIAARAVPAVTAPPLVPLPPPSLPAPQAEPTTRVFTLAPVPPPDPPAPSAPAVPAPPPAPPTVEVAPGAGAPGTQVVVSGADWAPGSTVAVVLLDPRGRATDTTASARVGEAGGFRVVLALRRDLPPGGHTLQVGDETRSARTPFRVVAPAPPAPPAPSGPPATPAPPAPDVRAAG